MSERDELFAALDTALAAMENGASLESALAADPARAAELRSLLLAALAAGAGADLPRVPAGAQVASRSQFLAGAAEHRGALAPAGPARRGQPGGWRAWLNGGGNWLARTAAVLLVMLGGVGLGGYGVVAASAPSLPGDALYGVKRTVEQTELLLATDAASRARLQREFDNRRVREALAVASVGRLVAVDFTGTLISMDGLLGQHWLVSGVAVLVGPQAPVTGTPRLGARVRVEGRVQTDGLVLALRVTVLPDGTPPADVTATPASTSTGAPTGAPTATPDLPTATPSAPTAQATATPANSASPTWLAPTDTQAPPDTLTPAGSPTPAATEAASATDDHGGGPGPSSSNTPEPTEAGGGGPGPSASNTPQATEDGGGGGPGPSASNTPRPTEIDDNHGGSKTATPSNGGGPSPSNTPGPTDSGGSGGGGGPSPSNTPKPGD